MSKKLIVGLVALTLSVTGVSATRWFRSSEKPTSACTPQDREAAEAEAAARHCRCQPKHWRFLMLQQQQ